MSSTQPASSGGSGAPNGLRIVLVTNGLRPISNRFTELPGSPIGIVAWDASRAGGPIEHISKVKALARLYAWIRRRKYASLSHLCLENSLLYTSIEKSRPAELRKLLSTWKAELVITSGCPLVPVSTLNSVEHGGINLHPSLLPAYRGADPFLWQIIDQVKYMGVSVHRLVDRYDAGPILGQTKVPRPRGMDRLALVNKLEGDIGFDLLHQVVSDLAQGDKVTQCEQAEHSPTRNASRMSLNVFGNTWKLNELSTDQVWDILSYYGQCPDQWLDLSGWRRLLSWQPASFQYATSHESPVDSTNWCIRKDGLAIYLVNRLAIITLRPRFRLKNH